MSAKVTCGAWAVVFGLCVGATACTGSGASAELGEVGDGRDAAGSDTRGDTTGSPGQDATLGSDAAPSGTTQAADDTATSTRATVSSTGSLDTTTGGPEVCGRGGPGPLEIGHGVGRFSPLSDGPTELEHGPQGGVHITLGIRSAGLDVSRFGDVQLRGTVDGNVVADHPQGSVLYCNERLGVAEAIWMSMVFDVGPEALHDHRIDLEISVTDALGNTVSAEAQTLIVDPLFVPGPGSTGAGGTAG